MTVTGEKSSIWVVFIVVVVTLGPMFYGNLHVKRAGILDNAILKTSDPYYVMGQQVDVLANQGLTTGEQVVLLIPFEHSLNKDDLKLVKKITDKVRLALPDVGILSLSTAAHYKDINDELTTDPYITDHMLSDSNFDMKVWQKDVRNDKGIYGLLIGRNFDYAQVILFLPSTCDEVSMFWRIVEMLEGRPISNIERYFKNNIQPAGIFAKVLPAGWLMGRGLTDASLLDDILRLSTLGLILAWCVFLLQLRSVRQASVATLVVALSFWWTRGSIGLLQMAGIGIYERVYILLVFTGQIVAGISFAEHKFASYHKIRQTHPYMKCAQVWQQSNTVHEMILITAVIAILNFITLYQIGVRGIMEVGFLSVIGIIWLLILVLVFMPAVHILIGGEASHKTYGFMSRLSNAWDRLLQKIVAGLHYVLSLSNDKLFNADKLGWKAIIIVIVFLVCAITFVLNGKLIIRTKPLEYIRHSIVYRASEFLKDPQRYGFDRIAFLVKPKYDAAELAVWQPYFLSETRKLQQALQRQPQFREVNFVGDTLGVIARESYKHELNTRQQLHDALQLIEWDLPPLVKEQLWYDGGFVMFASTNTMDDSNLMGQSCDQVLLTAKNFNLEVLPFGKVPLYPRADKYIREGKPINLLTSQWMIIAVYFVWLTWRNHKRKSAYKLSPFWVSMVMSVPFIFASSVITMVMVLCRVPLDQATACITALAINAAADFGLYPMAAFDSLIVQGHDVRMALSQALKDKGEVVLIDIILNCLCFAPLMCSVFLPVQRLGWVMIAMLVACGFGSLVLMPALLPWCVLKNKNN